MEGNKRKSDASSSSGIIIEENPSFLMMTALKVPVVIANPLVSLASFTVCVSFFFEQLIDELLILLNCLDSNFHQRCC
jgi:hypothetical protein